MYISTTAVVMAEMFKLTVALVVQGKVSRGRDFEPRILLCAREFGIMIIIIVVFLI